MRHRHALPFRAFDGLILKTKSSPQSVDSFELYLKGCRSILSLFVFISSEWGVDSPFVRLFCFCWNSGVGKFVFSLDTISVAVDRMFCVVQHLHNSLLPIDIYLLCTRHGEVFDFLLSVQYHLV